MSHPPNMIPPGSGEKCHKKAIEKHRISALAEYHIMQKHKTYVLRGNGKKWELWYFLWA